MTTEKGGRPLKFNSVEELETKIAAYFASCYITKLDDLGIEYKENIEPITMSGLALALNTNRQTLVNYCNKDEYFDTISRARETAEAYMERCLYTNKSVQGPMFAAKNNYGWVDKTEVETTVKENIKEKTTEELLQELKDLEEKEVNTLDLLTNYEQNLILLVALALLHDKNETISHV